jgi:rhodanese-related sulfurtransferase
MSEPSVSEPTCQRLAPQQLQDWLAARPDALVLDAREARHHALSHLAGSLRLDGRNHERLLLAEPKCRPVLIYCYHGHASQTWAGMFCDFGFSDVADLVGGWTAVDPQGLLQGAVAAADVLGASIALPRFPAVPAPLAAWLATEGYNPLRPDLPGPHGNTPLMHAAWRGAHHAVDALLALGVPLAAENHDGNNALWLACVQGEPGLIRALAASGVPIDHANLTGATALMYAASSGKAEVLATLLELGADPTITTQDDMSALDMAATLDCLQLLRPPRAGRALA